MARQKSNPFSKLNKKIRTLAISLLFLEFSLLFILNYSLFQPKAPPLTEAKNPIKIDSELLLKEKTNSPPIEILIPSVNIHLPVVEAKIVDGFWEISETTASHGVGSANPKDKGNIVIFAHARVGLFYNLKNIKENDEVYVLTKDSWRKYRVSQITSVYPNQTEVIGPTKNEVLTLYTCSGFSDEKRLIVKALPKD